MKTEPNEASRSWLVNIEGERTCFSTASTDFLFSSCSCSFIFSNSKILVSSCLCSSSVSLSRDSRGERNCKAESIGRWVYRKICRVWSRDLKRKKPLFLFSDCPPEQEPLIGTAPRWSLPFSAALLIQCFAPQHCGGDLSALTAPALIGWAAEMQQVLESELQHREVAEQKENQWNDISDQLCIFPIKGPLYLSVALGGLQL